MTDRTRLGLRPFSRRMAALAGVGGLAAALLGGRAAVAAEPAATPASGPPATPTNVPAAASPTPGREGGDSSWPPPSAAFPSRPAEPRAPSQIEVGAYVGPSFRLGGSATYDVQSHGGFSIGAAAFFAPSPRFALGLAYEHGQLGAEHAGGPELDSIDVHRSLDTLWFALRLRALDLPAVRIHVLLGPGIVWQSASASAILSTDIGAPPVGVACAATSSANLGLRAGAGVDFPLGSVASLGVYGTIDALRLTSDAIGTCVLGPGATTIISARAGFSFAFDVTGAVR